MSFPTYGSMGTYDVPEIKTSCCRCSPLWLKSTPLVKVVLRMYLSKTRNVVLFSAAGGARFRENFNLHVLGRK